MRAPLLGFLFALSLLAEDAKPLPQGVSLDIYIVEVEGEVDVQFAPKEAWMPAVKGAKLAVGSKLMSGIGGKAVFAFGSNSVAQMGEATSFEIRSFGMQGDKLVANVLIDPGVAHVALKQLGAFQTDFQVSTPRLTCSVRGSMMRVRAHGDEITDEADCPEDEAFVEQVNGQERDLAENEQTNSDNDSNQTILATDNLSGGPPEGSTEQEGSDENLLLQNAGSIDLNVSDATVDTDPSPSGGDGGTLEGPPPTPSDFDPAQIAADEQFLLDHGLDALVFFLQTGDPGHRQPAQDQFYGVNVNQTTAPIYVEKREAILYLIRFSQFGGQLEDLTGIVSPREAAYLEFTAEAEDVVSHAGKDGKPLGNPSFGGGFEGQAHDDALLYAKRNGFPAFVNDVFAPYLLARFNEDPTGLKSTPAGLDIFNAILADFHDDGSGYGFDQLLVFLQQADAEVHDEGLYTPFAEDILLAMLHKEFETAEVDPPASREAYQIEHDAFINGNFADLLDVAANKDFDHFLAAYGRTMLDVWNDNTGLSHVRGEPNPGDFNFDGIQHFRGDLLSLLAAAREATGTAGVQSSQEFGAAGVFSGMDELRHRVQANDILDFQGAEAEAKFGRSAVQLVGLKAAFDEFDAYDLIRQVNNSSLFTTDRPLFDIRLADFKNIDNFGYDALVRDWRDVADHSRAGTLDPTLLGTAMIEDVRAEQFRDIFDQPALQFDPARANLQIYVNTMSAALASGYPAFLTQFEAEAHNRYHQETSIPINPQNADLGFDAHQSFHAALQQFDADAHAAVAPPQ